jgi:hypothetical protein
MNVDLLPSQSVGARAGRVRSTLRVLDTPHAEHVDVEVMASVPVVNVNHDVVQLDVHARKLRSFEVRSGR